VITARLAGLTLVALVLGTSFCHVLEMPAKLAYEGAFYVMLQTTLYAHFGPPGVGGLVEPAAILAVGLVAYLARGRRPAFALTLASGVCLLLAFPVIFFALTEPVNAAFRDSAATGELPLEWQWLRVLWELSHAVRFALHLSGFGLLALSVLLETRYSASSPMLGEGPPSMTMVVPFMNEEASDARKTHG
jgi:Domain of unknown function (DUF1772)